MLISIFLISLTILLIIIHALSGFVNGSVSYTEKAFKKSNVDHLVNYTQFGDRQIRSVSTGDPNSKTLVCFIHGAPGAWNAFKSYMVDPDILEECMMVSVDRFGYGASEYGKPEFDISTQSKAIKSHLSYFEFDTLLLIGHSYGGPIAAKIAIDFPDKVKHVFMISPVIDPESEKHFWFNNIFALSPIKMILPKYVNVSVEEKLNHEESLRQLKGDWVNINVPVTHWHCSDDWIAPAKGNVDFSKRYIAAAKLNIELWEGDGHLIPFNQFEKVKTKLLQLLAE